MKPDTLKITSPEKQLQEIEKVLETLKRGGIVCFPTDTVYGLGVDAKNEKAVQKLYQLKKRPSEKPLILFLKEHGKVVNFVKKIPLSALKLIRSFWPGPLTIVFEASIKNPACLVSREGKIGIRISSHPVAKEISTNGKITLATTSANLSTQTSVSEPGKISPAIKEGVNLIIDSGKTPLGKESTVIDVTINPPRVLREGSVSKNKLRSILNKRINILFVCTANVCRSVMAEAIFKSIWAKKGRGDVNVKSAGISAFSHSPPSKNTVEIMKKRGINVQSHLSRKVTAELVDESDVIFVMEKGHKYYLTGFYPLAQNKVWLLKEFSSGREEEVSDPVGLSQDYYEKTADEIEREIEKVVEKMV